jgi:hypothetical protein
MAAVVLEPGQPKRPILNLVFSCLLISLTHILIIVPRWVELDRIRVRSLGISSRRLELGKKSIVRRLATKVDGANEPQI